MNNIRKTTRPTWLPKASALLPGDTHSEAVTSQSVRNSLLSTTRSSGGATGALAPRNKGLRGFRSLDAPQTRAFTPATSDDEAENAPLLKAVKKKLFKELKAPYTAALQRLNADGVFSEQVFQKKSGLLTAMVAGMLKGVEPTDKQKDLIHDLNYRISVEEKQLRALQAQYATALKKLNKIGVFSESVFQQKSELLTTMVVGMSNGFEPTDEQKNLIHDLNYRMQVFAGAGAPLSG